MARWKVPCTWGTENAVLVENNTFTGSTSCGTGCISSHDSNSDRESSSDQFYTKQIAISSCRYKGLRIVVFQDLRFIVMHFTDYSGGSCYDTGFIYVPVEELIV